MAAVTRWQDAVLQAGTELGPERLGALACEALVGALPVLRSDRDLLELARASSVANVALALAVIRGELAFPEIDPPPHAIAFTRELARRNVPVSELARGYRVAQHEVWRWAAGEIHARIADPERVAKELARLSEAMFAGGDLLSTLIMERYAQEREQWVRSADAVRAATVEALLGEGPVDVEAAASRLRYDLAQLHQAFVVWSEDGETLPQRAAETMGGGRALLVPRGVGVIAGWAPAAAFDAAAAGAGASVALGIPQAGVRGFRRSHRQALEARRVARTFGSRTRVVRYENVSRLALLTHDLDQAREFAARVLGPLARGDRHARRLAQTLLVVLEEQGSPRRASRRLGVHENTVAKRLRAIDGILDPVQRAGPADLLAALTIELGYATEATAGSSL